MPFGKKIDLIKNTPPKTFCIYIHKNKCLFYKQAAFQDSYCFWDTRILAKISYRKKETFFPLRTSFNRGRCWIQFTCLDVQAATFSTFQEKTPDFLHVKYLLLSKVTHWFWIYYRKLSLKSLTSMPFSPTALRLYLYVCFARSLYFVWY